MSREGAGTSVPAPLACPAAARSALWAWPLCVPVGSGLPASRPRSLWRRWCSGRRLVSGRRVACPPARRPRCELRSARRLEARPGPAGLAAASNRAVLIVCVLPARPRHRPPAPRLGPRLLYVAQLWLSIINFACNSPAACSNIEFASSELQRFLGLLKFGPIELHAKMC